ncbi:carbonic anhydrase [Methanobacterium alcaliphilum]|uniref:carbonic anhydrase n=1 Tax=Methanobacterium alcaliphilum TaxID=392018 RepID=UPI00200AA7B6|nr:carbonic anhydrase [Methanobacterium alcaliphilum]MCK9152618.1 hypothetical protein [Methanobacterium alcaliphilum]
MDNIKTELDGKFAACLNCIDGRVQIPTIKWIMSTYGVDFVDMITEPGMDGFLVDSKSELTHVLDKLSIALKVHDCKEIFIVAHEDCAANPVDFETHTKNLMIAVEKIKKFATNCTVIGIYVYLNGEVEKIMEN